MIDAAAGRALTYGQLQAQVERLAAELAQPTPADKRLFYVFADNSVEAIIAYLAGLTSEAAVALLNPALHPALAEELVESYQPEWLWFPPGRAIGERITSAYDARQGDGGAQLLRRRQAVAAPIHPDLALLLTTSGSTGSPKFVRLTRDNLLGNAASIAEYLGLGPAERPITSLPLYYSYGLSVVNSHLLAGACLVCTGSGVMQKAFWDAARAHECTSLAGVPYMYEMLRRLRFERMELPHLRTLTQAGGALGLETKKYVLDACERSGRRFYVMYGQTEATARISYVPPAQLAGKLGSIGVPIPRGQMWLEADGREIREPHVQGEIVYRGPNVMLGYATTRACLAKGDELGGVLRTGDLAYRDGEGFFYVVGRLKRFIKLFGNRVNLDEVESLVERHLRLPAACLGHDDLLMVACEAPRPAADLEGRVVDFLASMLGVHASAIAVRLLPQLPVTSTLKKDYARIRETFACGV